MVEKGSQISGIINSLGLVFGLEDLKIGHETISIKKFNLQYLRQNQSQVHDDAGSACQKRPDRTD